MDTTAKIVFDQLLTAIYRDGQTLGYVIPVDRELHPTDYYGVYFPRAWRYPRIVGPYGSENAAIEALESQPKVLVNVPPVPPYTPALAHPVSREFIRPDDKPFVLPEYWVPGGFTPGHDGEPAEWVRTWNERQDEPPKLRLDGDGYVQVAGPPMR